MLRRIFYVSFLIELMAPIAHAEQNSWGAVNIDNDILLGNDNGYTNGIYFSWFNFDDENEDLKPGWLSAPLNWSIDLENAEMSLKGYSLGQVMVTPEDITVEEPPFSEIPYSGSLLLSSTFITVQESTADSIVTVIGIVGPSSRAEQTQKWVHEQVGADIPQGWDTQLEDEFVFQLSRARLWRAWNSHDDDVDLLVLADAGLGTLSSYVSSAGLIRYGRDLSSSFETPLLINARSANPAAVRGGWFFFAGVRLEYVFNAIYSDGNTFRDSRSIDYDRSQIGLTTGLAYSWEDVSITLALYESNASDASARDVTRFGTLTLGWEF